MKDEVKFLKYSAPWYIFYQQVNALFAQDPEVEVKFIKETNELHIYVEATRKFDAICMLFPEEKTFGNVTIKIKVHLANEGERTWSDIFADAFDGNPIFEFTKHQETALGTIDYVVFSKDVVQYYSDNLFDYYGFTSTLAQDIAEEIFDTGDDTVSFCTSVEANEAYD